MVDQGSGGSGVRAGGCQPQSGTKLLLPPSMKMGQSNIFRSVCQEFCSRGRGVGIPACHAGHMTSLGEGCPGPGPGVSRHRPGGCVSQHALRQTPPSRRLLLRAVRILLACILVWHKFCQKLHENENKNVEIKFKGDVNFRSHPSAPTGKLIAGNGADVQRKSAQFNAVV